MDSIIPFTTAHEQRPMAAAIGFFDGVHLGHRYLLNQVKQAARQRGYGAMAVTFAAHPREVLSATYRPALLTTTEEKLALLRAEGLDACALLHFTPAMAKLTAGDFMATYLRQRLGVRTLIMGYDHHFGSDHLTLDEYVAAGHAVGIDVVKAEAFKTTDFTVSSSTVRRLLEGGDVARATQCLGRAYELQGTVVEGRHVGRDLGFPTANLRPSSPQKLVPGRGVYAVEARVGEQAYGAMLNIGFRPTIANGRDVTIEAHIFGFSGNLYDHQLRLRFLHRLRDEQRFATLDELRHQLATDAQRAREWLYLL